MSLTDDFEMEEEEDIYEEVIPRSMKGEVTDVDKDGFRLAAKRFSDVLDENDTDQTKKASFAILDYMEHVYMAGAASGDELLDLASACVRADSIQSVEAAKRVAETKDFVESEMFEDLFIILAERTDSKLQQSDSKKSQFGKLMKTYRALFISLQTQNSQSNFINPELVVIWERLFRTPNPYDANLLDFIDHNAIVDALNKKAKIKLLKSMNTFMDINSSTANGEARGTSIKNIWKALGKGGVREMLNGCLGNCGQDAEMAPIVVELFTTCYGNLKQAVWCETVGPLSKSKMNSPPEATKPYADPEDTEDYCPLSPLTEFNMSIHENVVFSLLKIIAGSPPSTEKSPSTPRNDKPMGNISALSEEVCPKLIESLALRLGLIAQLGFACSANRGDCVCKLDPISSLCRDICLDWLTQYRKIGNLQFTDSSVVTGIAKFIAEHPSAKGFVGLQRLYPQHFTVIRKQLSWLFRTGFRCCFPETELLLELVIKKDPGCLTAEDVRLVVKLLMKHPQSTTQFERLLRLLKNISDDRAELIPNHDSDFYRLAVDQYSPSTVPNETCDIVDEILVNICAQCPSMQETAVGKMIKGCATIQSFHHTDNVLTHLQALASDADTKYLVEGHREWLEAKQDEPETQIKATKILKSLIEPQASCRKSGMCIVC